jgi:tRNA threonylcarbamoyladenosine biosynthesis protein TsaE
MTETLHRSGSPEETVTIARSLAERYPGKACFYLEGDLGAGKTLFAKGIASAYGVDMDRVVSPTFALVNRYGGGRCPVYHIDLYRIDKERELDELGLGELEDEAAVIVVEWAEKLGRYRRPDAVLVRLDVADEESRNIQITEPDS